MPNPPCLRGGRRHEEAGKAHNAIPHIRRSPIAMTRTLVLGLTLVAAFVVCGCYGSTEPATNVRFDGAQLNGRGTANSGRASSFFEYWPTANPQAKLTTDPQHWPAGASGPFSATISAKSFNGPLYAGTAYSFRMCGSDEGQSAICAQTRSFTTPRPTKDAVEGFWKDTLASPHVNTGTVLAMAGSSGPTGTLTFSYRKQSAYDYAGRVTCLVVTGSRAVVGSVGEVTTDGSPPNSNANPPTATLVATIVDGGPGVVDSADVTLTPGSSTPPSCTSPPSPSVQATESVNVYDAP
jgi:hypothetical protein